VNAWRTTIPTLAAGLAVVIACGTGTTAPSGSPPGPAQVQEDTPPGVLEAPGPWAPSRALRLDRFALETALGVALVGPIGAELGSYTRWTFSGGETELRLELRTAFSGAEAEVQCRTLAGEGAVQSLGLGTPLWTGANDVFVTRKVSCIRVSVTRSGRADVAGAMAVAGALVRAE
jgi:hypothetical protein